MEQNIMKVKEFIEELKSKNINNGGEIFNGSEILVVYRQYNDAGRWYIKYGISRGYAVYNKIWHLLLDTEMIPETAGDKEIVSYRLCSDVLGV